MSHKDLNKVCPSFSFEINLNLSDGKDTDVIELEEIKEITVDPTINKLDDISLMGVHPHHIPKHAINNYVDINFNFDQKINHI